MKLTFLLGLLYVTMAMGEMTKIAKTAETAEMAKKFMNGIQ